MNEWTNTGPTTCVQFRDDNPFPRAQTTTNKQWQLISRVYQCHHGTTTTLLTPKLTQTLNHAASGSQVSFVAAAWCLGIPSRILNFANTRFSRKRHPELETPCGKMTRGDHRQAVKRNCVLHFTCSTFRFTADIHNTSKIG